MLAAAARWPAGSAGSCRASTSSSRSSRHRCRASSNSSRSSASSAAAAAAAPPPAPELSAAERASLAAALQAAGVADAASLGPTARQHVLDTLAAGARREVQDLSAVEGAVLLAEQLHRAANAGRGDAWPPGAADVPPQAVDAWQPVFASAGGLTRLTYIPVPEYFDLHRSLADATAISLDADGAGIAPSSDAARAAAAAGPGRGRLAIITELGPLTTFFLGSAAWSGDGATLEYEVSSVRLELGGGRVELPLGPLALRNALTFFLCHDGLGAARSRLGGTMLMLAEPQAARRYFDAW